MNSIGLNIYVDGGYSHEIKKGSWAYVVNHNIFDCGEVSDCAGAFHAELEAVKQALIFVNKELISCQVSIICDNKAIVARFDNIDKFTPINHIEEWKFLKQNSYGVVMFWERRCSNNKSELADSLCTTILRSN